MSAAYESGPGYDATIEGWGGTPLARQVGRVLTDRGHYDETADAFAWHQGDCANVARAIGQFGASPAVVKAALLDTAVHASEDGGDVHPDDAACLAGDIAGILDLLSAATPGAEGTEP